MIVSPPSTPRELENQQQDISPKRLELCDSNTNNV